MKKALYGTTALVAAGLVAGQASAASGLKLGISGYYRGAIGVEFGDSNQTFGGPPSSGTGDWGRQTVAFRQEVRVNFTGETTLDNGLTFDVLVGLNAGGGNKVTSNAPARINRAYMDVSGKFGQIRFGDANSAYQSMCVGDPGNVTANFGLNSPNETFSNAGRAMSTGGAGFLVMPTAISGEGTCYGDETRSTKIIYFSPTFGGFNFGVSYAPHHIRSAGGSGGTGGTQSNIGFTNFLSAGVNFTHDFGGVTLTAGVAGDWALSGKTAATDNAGNLGNKPSMYQGGIQVAWGPWAVGASGQYVVNYVGAGMSGVANGNSFTTLSAPSDDAYMITAGGSWTMDAISIGLEGVYDHFATSAAGATAVGMTREQYYGASLNASYALGPGISLEGQFAWTQSNSNATVSNDIVDINAFEIDFGTAINF